MPVFRQVFLSFAMELFLQLGGTGFLSFLLSLVLYFVICFFSYLFSSFVM